jgi:hypothetical protein
MKEIKNMMFTSILIIFSFIFSKALAAETGKFELEQEVKLIEQESKISEIKFVSKEIEKQVAKRKSSSDEQESSTVDDKHAKHMRINSNFKVTGGITANRFFAETAELTGNTRIGHKLQSNTINTDKLVAQTIVVEKLLSSTGVITIEADVIINNDIMANTISMRGASFVLEGVKQWGLTHHDDFETEKSLEGWSDKRVSRCKNSKNTFLGGHCNLSFNEVTKVFKSLPPHEKLKVNAAFHMLDSWDGEYAYMKIEDEKVWTKRGQYSPDKGIDICGGDHNDPAFNIPINVSIPHTGNEVKISFGSTLDEEPCNESFGIDDVMIYVR